MMYGQVGWDVVFLLPLGNHRTITERNSEKVFQEAA